MRTYLVRILALSLFTSICDFFLPEGNIRKFASPILSLSVTAAILLPLPSLFSASPSLSSLLPEIESAVAQDGFTNAVEEAYKARIGKEIAARGGTLSEIELDSSFAIRRLVLTGEESLSAMHYIFTELEVPRERVEIRKAG